jgi:hypothetical protein
MSWAKGSTVFRCYLYTSAALFVPLHCVSNEKCRDNVISVTGTFIYVVCPRKQYKIEKGVKICTLIK